MSDTNGTMSTEAVEVKEVAPSRVKKSRAKINGKASAFQRWFTGLRDAEGGKEQAGLTRKTEEGKLTITIKGYPNDFTLEGICELAEEVGLKATIKSEAGVGKYEANVTKTLVEDAASGFIEYANE